MYAEVFSIAERFLDSIAMRAHPVPGEGLRVVNLLSWNRDVLASVRYPSAAVGSGTARVTIDGEVVPSTFVIREDDVEIVFLARNVHALSYADCEISFVSEAFGGRSMGITQSSEGIIVENERYRAVIDSEGRIASLFDRRVNRQVLSAPGNDIRLFLDGPSREDAWNIENIYKTRETHPFTDCRVEIAENSDLRAVVRVTKSGERSTLEQDIIFYHDKQRIDFRTRVNWQEKNKMMRVYFPTSMNAPSFTSEVGFGAYSRPTIGNTKLDKAKFEVVAHRWIDISESDYGVSLLNDSKYGHDVQYNTIGLTLLRSTGYPADYPDIGIQEFTYSLYPHAENWAKSDVVRAAAELNAEIHAVNIIGRSAFAEELFTCDSRNIIIDTIKRTEQGNGIVVRMYEANGTSGHAVLTCSRAFRDAVESDLVERKLSEADHSGTSVRFTFTPYEIKTFIFHF